MPESKPRKKPPARTAASAAQANKPNPVWFKPVMFGLMIIGLLWIITFYISEGQLPGPGMGVLEHRGRLRDRDRRLPDDHPLALLTRRADPAEARRRRHHHRRGWSGPTAVGFWRSPSAGILRQRVGASVRDEQGLYERISLEGFQAGLSWATILRKRPAFRAAFHGLPSRYRRRLYRGGRRAADAGCRHRAQPPQDPGRHHQCQGHHRAAGRGRPG